MKALLARREAEGKPLSEEQLRDLLRESGRDAHPILHEAIERLNAEPTPPAQEPTGTS